MGVAVRVKRLRYSYDDEPRQEAKKRMSSYEDGRHWTRTATPIGPDHHGTAPGSAFTMHVESGHSTCPEEGPKDLRCPLCLYHTKYKHNMIDHIVLHREERVVPIEVCRSKLSKQLQGVVFRCDKCTFTCSSDDSLQQHIEKHNELKPYKCQLCYYQTKLNEELDSHLREEHKAVGIRRSIRITSAVNRVERKRSHPSVNVTSAAAAKSSAGAVGHCSMLAKNGIWPNRQVTDYLYNLVSKECSAYKLFPVELVMFALKLAKSLDPSRLRFPCDVAKVCRNFELVGLVNLDQLEQMKDKTETSSSDEEESTNKNGELSDIKTTVQEKRFPCEFCGRTFTLNTEWERHVLRHGIHSSELTAVWELSEQR
ncbi:unnamed protein product [Ranitomeya imitator]|uniref:C2H2-type domain-containing protein n=1 Tax=Ranitomeya imitator TaxID=111125 RepID=A0ABN9M4C5_9NEOB|nr:unnamed protein product [Ranitomeya imitator]